MGVETANPNAAGAAAKERGDPRLIVALDLPDSHAAFALTEKLRDDVAFYKIGLQLIPIGGMDLAQALRADRKGVFLDFKLLDIPATVEKAVRSIVKTGANLLTVHAEPDAMQAAVQGRGDSGLALLAVTAMTSHDDASLAAAGFAFGARDLVLRRTEQALDAGMDGVVASPLEAEMLRERFGSEFLIVTPGVRPKGAALDDQKRAATPKAALAAGASHLVVGRPITAAEDPVKAVRAIVREIAGV
jgi:orotidine-5'-phosphate decarboxylase